ncbi:MAG TPA: transglutaminase-like domain-containing protein [Rudaea sp.]|nr:transglutaminase-like domain-containing protein [Rudaea sp.]
MGLPSLRWAAGIMLSVVTHAGMADVHWFTLKSDGVRTGFVREERSAGTDGSVRLSERVVIAVRQLGRKSRIERRVAVRQGADGGALEYDYSLSSGTVNETWRGTFAGSVLVVKPVKGAPQRISLPDDALLTPDRTALLATLQRSGKSSATFTVFDPARRSAGPLRVQRVDDDATPTGSTIHLRSGGGMSAGGEDLWFDANGELERLDARLLGSTLTWRPCTQDCEADVVAPMEAMRYMMVSSPVEIPSSERHHTLRYMIARTDGGTPQIVGTSEQAVAFDGARAIVTICDDCGAAEAPAAGELARYTAPNAWVRSDDKEIRGLALDSVLRSARTEYRMQKLANAVMQHMRGSSDLLGYADAVTALHTGAGDCTEFAVLLAALARAQGIPARVVAGLAYSDSFSGRKDVFVPHMWVQAWNGARWKSYDAALGDFDATHIALAVGSGVPEDFERLLAQLPLLRIEKAGVVRAPRKDAAAREP